MKLNKEHREALLTRLNKISEELGIKKECIAKTDSKDGVYRWHEIDEFLLEKQKQEIEKALVENDIDY